MLPFAFTLRSKLEVETKLKFRHFYCYKMNTTILQVKLSWRSAIDEGGAPVTGYVVQRRDTKRDAWLDVATVEDPKETTLTVSQVIEGESYHFQVMAVNKEGRGEPTQSQMVTVENPYRCLQ